MNIVAGVDCHKESHTIVFLNSVGEMLKEMTIETTPDGYRAAITTVRPLGEVIWALEGTGSYGHAFAQFLLAEGDIVYEVPGMITKRHRKHGSRVGKSDAIDARAIAEALLREGDRLPKFRELAEQEALRVRYDQRDRLIGERTKAVNRLRAAALWLNVTLPKDLTSTKTAKNIGSLVESLRTSDHVTEAYIDEAVFAADDIERINLRVARLEKVLKDSVSTAGSSLLGVFGISFVLAAGLIGHTGDLRNCRNADAFAMRSATAPIPYSSGKNQRVRVNCGGDRKLNRALHHVALVQIRFPDTKGYAYYHRKLNEGKTPRAAIRALKRRLATVVYYRLAECQRRLENVTINKSAA